MSIKQPEMIINTELIDLCMTIYMHFYRIEFIYLMGKLINSGTLLCHDFYLKFTLPSFITDRENECDVAHKEVKRAFVCAIRRLHIIMREMLLRWHSFVAQFFFQTVYWYWKLIRKLKKYSYARKSNELFAFILVGFTFMC